VASAVRMIAKAELTGTLGRILPRVEQMENSPDLPPWRKLSYLEEKMEPRLVERNGTTYEMVRTKRVNTSWLIVIFGEAVILER
jgi:hypothetical protein